MYISVGDHGHLCLPSCCSYQTKFLEIGSKALMLSAPCEQPWKEHPSTSTLIYTITECVFPRCAQHLRTLAISKQSSGKGMSLASSAEGLYSKSGSPEIKERCPHMISEKFHQLPASWLFIIHFQTCQTSESQETVPKNKSSQD